MDNKMFCFQCEQAAHCTGCTGSAGVCGKSAETANLQDELTGALVGLARATDGSPDVNEGTWSLIIEALFTTLTNVNFDAAAIRDVTARVKAEKSRLVPDCASCMSPCGHNNDYDVSRLWTADEDIRSLKSLILFGIRGMAAYAYHAMVLGYTDDEVDHFFAKALFAIGEDWGMDDLLPLVLEVGEKNYRCMALLDKANTDVKQAEQDKTAADTRLDVLTDAKNALAKAQTAYDQAKSEADQAQQAKQTAQDELAQAQTAYEQAKKESDKAAQQVKDLENAKTDLAARTQALAAAQADLDAKTQAYDAARNEADKAKQAETDAETAVRNAQQALTDAQARLAKAKSDAKDTEAVKTAQAKVKEAQDALDQAKTILAKAQADLKQAQTVEAQAKSDYETAKAALKTAQQAANPKHDDNAGQTSLNAAQQATVEAAAKADKVMASTGADTNGIILAVVAFAGMGAATLDLKRRRMDVTARHGMR